MRNRIGDSRLLFDVEGAKLRPDRPRMKEAKTSGLRIRFSES